MATLAKDSQLLHIPVLVIGIFMLIVLNILAQRV